MRPLGWPYSNLTGEEIGIHGEILGAAHMEETPCKVIARRQQEETGIRKK